MSENKVATREYRINRLMDMCPAVADSNELLSLIAAARDAYVGGGAAGPKELAKQFPKLPREVCQKMVDLFGWRKQRAERLEDLQVAAAVEYADYLRSARTTVAKNLVDQLGPAVKMLTDEIGTSLGDADSKYRTMDARRLAEAVAQLADKLMKAAAVDGTMPELPESALPDGKAKGKQPWMTINAAGPVTIGKTDVPGRDVPAEQEEQENEDD